MIADRYDLSPLGFQGHLLATPGHSPGCCCLYERRSRVLFSGDHLLKHITPNPFHETNRSRLRDPAYKSLKSYMASLDKLEPLDIRYAFPAHGEFIEDVAGLLEGYRDHHRARTETILSALGHGAHSVYDLAGAVFPSAEESEAFLAVSEIIVHLEILVEEDRLQQRRRILDHRTVIDVAADATAGHHRVDPRLAVDRSNKDVASLYTAADPAVIRITQGSIT